MRAKGVGMVEALEIVRDAMRVVPEAQRDARWRQRYDDLPRCAEQIYGKNLGKGETRYQRPEGEQAHLDGFDLHEDGLAQAFTAKYRDVLRFCWDAGKWYRWTGNLWQRDRTKLAFSWARKVCRQLAHESGAGDKLKSILAKAATAAAVEKYAQAAAPHSVTSEIWDTDPFLLGTPGGTIDLRTGELREARREDYITKATAITPAATPDCDLWLRFLNEACGQDAGLIRFLQQFSGYLLTGDTREHALLFIYGPGGNGKSVWLNTVAGIQAALDYVRDGDTLLVTKPDRLARSTADLLAIVERLESKGVGLVVLSMGGQRIDTRTATGKLMLTMLGAIAAFERDLMLERQREGIAKAKSEGKYRGRAPTARRLADQVRELKAKGIPPTQIAQQLKIGRASVYRVLADKPAAV